MIGVLHVKQLHIAAGRLWPFGAIIGFTFVTGIGLALRAGGRAVPEQRCHEVKQHDFFAG